MRIMPTVTATELARHASEILDRVAIGHETLVIVRNQRPLARLVPEPARMSLREALGLVAGRLPMAAGETWLRDARVATADTVDELEDPWRS